MRLHLRKYYRFASWPFILLLSIIIVGGVATAICLYVLPMRKLAATLLTALPLCNSSESLLFPVWLGLHNLGVGETDAIPSLEKTRSSPVRISYWLFNFTNFDEFIKGGGRIRPEFLEIGPFTYHKLSGKRDVTFSAEERDDGASVSYKSRSHLVFDPTHSVSRTDKTGIAARICLVDISVLSLILSPDMDSFLFSFLLPGLSRNLSCHSVHKHLFLRKTAIGDTNIALQQRSNHSDSALLTVRTGRGKTPRGNSDSNTLDELGRVIGFRSGSRVVRRAAQSSSAIMMQSPIWTSNTSNMINGTDGTVFPPLISNAALFDMSPLQFVQSASSVRPPTHLYIFASEFCRSFKLEFVRRSAAFSEEGGGGGAPLPGWTYSLARESLWNATRNPWNAGFCSGGNILPNYHTYTFWKRRPRCLPSGLLDLTPCLGKPTTLNRLILSLPRMTHAAPHIRNRTYIVPALLPRHPLNVDGGDNEAERRRNIRALNSSRMLDSEFVIHPHTGLLLSARKSLQLNVRFDEHDFHHFNKSAVSLKDLNLPSKNYFVLPLFRLVEAGQMPDQSAQRLYSKLHRPIAVIAHVLWGLAALLLVCAVLLCTLIGLRCYISANVNEMVLKDRHEMDDATRFPAKSDLNHNVRLRHADKTNKFPGDKHEKQRMMQQQQSEEDKFVTAMGSPPVYNQEDDAADSSETCKKMNAQNSPPPITTRSDVDSQVFVDAPNHIDC